MAGHVGLDSKYIGAYFGLIWVWISLHYIKERWDSLVAQIVKHLPAMRDTQVWSLSWEDPLEKEMATHSSTLA